MRTLAAGVASLVLALVTDLPERAGARRGRVGDLARRRAALRRRRRRSSSRAGRRTRSAGSSASRRSSASSRSSPRRGRTSPTSAASPASPGRRSSLRPGGWIGVALVASTACCSSRTAGCRRARWRRLAWASAALLVVYAVATAMAPGADPEAARATRTRSGVPGMDVVRAAGVVLFLGLVAARSRRSSCASARRSGDERQQLSDRGRAVCFALPASRCSSCSSPPRTAGPPGTRWPSLHGLARRGPADPDRGGRRDPPLPPLRRRPRDLAHDRLRALTLILGAAYTGLVLAGQAVFSSFAGGSNLAIAVSTLVVAALFLPVRRACSGSSTGASTGAATTPSARWTRSGRGCASRWTWRRCAAICAASSTRRCSRPTCRCGSARRGSRRSTAPARQRRSVAASVLIVVAVVVDLVTIATAARLVRRGHRPRRGAGLRRARADRPPIVRRRRGNPIGVLFAALVLVTAPALLADSYAVLVADPGSGRDVRPRRGVGLELLVGRPGQPARLRVAVAFPDGSLLSHRWRWAERLGPRPGRHAHARAGVRARHARQLSDRQPARDRGGPPSSSSRCEVIGTTPAARLRRAGRGRDRAALPPGARPSSGSS